MSDDDHKDDDDKNGEDFKKITEREIAETAHVKGGRLGVSKCFLDAFNFLKSLGGYDGQSISRIAEMMYEPGRLHEDSERKCKANKDVGCWATDRLQNTIYGKLSFAPREMAFHHGVLRKVVGRAWADQVEPEELLNTPFRQILVRLIRSGLPSEWDRLPPIAALRILEASQEDLHGRPHVEITRTSSTRLAGTRDEERTDISFRPLIDRITMKVGDRFFLDIADLPPDRDCLVVNYMDDPFVVASLNPPILAKPITERRPEQNTIRMTADDGEPLWIVDLPGEFGFAVVTFQKGLDVADLFGLDPTAPYYTEDEMRMFAKNLHMKLTEDPAVTLTLRDYRTEPKQNDET